MVKKTIKYVDFNGNENEETLYFNLSKSELTMIELGKKDGMSNFIKEAVESGDNAAIVRTFADIIIQAYGEKSEDGKRFIKNERMKEDFKNSAAYDALFMEIVTEPESANNFIQSLIN